MSDLRQAIDDYMDYLATLPESKLRAMFADKRIPRNVDFTATLGGTEYIVTSRFNQHSGDDMVRKLTRLLESSL